MRVAIDTNILAYGEGINDLERRRVAGEVIGRLPVEDVVVPVQVLGELFNVLRRKGRFPAEQAGSAVIQIIDSFEIAETTSEVFVMAVDLSTSHDLNIWDAVILCAASRANCRVLLSEDMQDGFTWGGVTVVNPFAESPHPLLAAILES